MAKVSSTPEPCDLAGFFAHPDDAELACGGTLALAVERGWKAAVVDFTRGELGTRGTPEIRTREATEAADVLGLTCRINLALADGHLHDGDEPRRKVVELLRLLRPRVVLAPPLDDHHADHVAVATILARSVYLSGVEKYCPGLPPWRPHVLLHALGSRAAAPRLVVDVSAVIEKRRQAVRCYRSQFHLSSSSEPETRISHPEFLEWIDGMLRQSGFLIGASYGEAFTSAEPVPVADPVAQFARAPWQERRAGP
jgi:bacillithiol biosynthesis deacetylase BshB1